MKSDVKIDYANYVLFAGESDFQTNEKSNRNIGNMTHLVQPGTVPQTICCTNDHRFTILPFTSASGEAVCCVLIFKCQSEELPMIWKTGIDVTVDPAKDENGKIDFKVNLGEGKYFPGGPKCRFKGKEVECLAFASES